jgi:thiamine phosphate synthase YjbQ (UPF0047 family)
LQITVTDLQPAGTTTRFVVIFADQSPAFVNVTGLVDLMVENEDIINSIVMVASDGSSAPVTIEKEVGQWVVRLDAEDHNDAVLLESVEYADDEMIHREVYVPGFADEAVPFFTAESMRR